MSITPPEWREFERKILSAFAERVTSDDEVLDAIKLLLWHIADNKRKILRLKERLDALERKRE
ncbi:MAG: hypothetical protein ACE5KH_05800 [Candidatus Geothermarchaeales archaeon]